MPGLVPGIHDLFSQDLKDVDGRDKHGHDDEDDEEDSSTTLLQLDLLNRTAVGQARPRRKNTKPPRHGEEGEGIHDEAVRR
jgi:hypothetical protein